MAFRTAVIGLGLVGSSIGLALKKKGADLEIVGHDKDHEAARRAHKNGCVDRTEWNLISACDGADLVVISTPLAGIKSTLTAIATELREGCVVTDTASLKVPVLSWARESLPATVHFVGGHPVVRTLKRGYGVSKGEAGAAEPSADLFAGALYCLTPATNAPPSALQRVSDLAEAIGARPYYMDAAEHDGLIAAVEQVPLLMGLALLDVARSSPAHREVARLSNVDFDRVIEALAGDAQQLSEICTLNGTNVVRWLDSLLSRLTTLREAAAHQDSESLQEAFARALEARVAWARSEIESGETDYSDFSMTHMIMGDMFRPRPDQPQR